MANTEVIIKTYEFKLRTNKKFVAECEKTLNDARFVYNCALEQRINLFQQTGKGINWIEQSRQLTEARKELPEIGNVLRTIQSDALERLELAFKAFFKRPEAGFPRFKGKERYHTFSQKLEAVRPCPLKGDKLTVPGVGSCRVRLSRELPENAKVKQLRITRRASGWYALLVTEIPKPEPLAKTGLSVGVDVGIKSFATLSTGEEIANPRHLQQAGEKLAKFQRRLSRKKKGSANRRKARKQVALLHEKVANTRKDFHHKVALDLVKRFDTIALEKLNIRGLVRNHKLAKAITDVAWGNFKLILTSKAENAGKSVVEVNPAYTSQTCSKCGHRQKMPLKIRIFDCENCGHIQDRDVNAANNIQTRAELAQSNACGDHPVRVSAKQERESRNERRPNGVKRVASLLTRS